MFNLDTVARGCSVREGILKNFINLTGKQLYQRSQACNFIKKDILLQVFSCEFGEIFNNAIFYRTRPMAASVNYVMFVKTGYIFIFSNRNYETY